MPLHVQRQVVGAREGTVAEVALEGPVARVLAVVAREFVRARELPAAAVPVAVVGLLACVRAQVRLEVRALGVGLAAARVAAGVRGGALARPGAAAALGLGFQQLQRGRGRREQTSGGLCARPALRVTEREGAGVSAAGPGSPPAA